MNGVICIPRLHIVCTIVCDNICGFSQSHALVSLSNSSSDVNTNSCGQDSGKYDANPGDSAYRRLMTVEVFIAS